MKMNIVFESCLYDTNFCIHKLAIMWFQQQVWRNKFGWQANIFLIWPYFYYDIFSNARSHKNTLQQNWLHLKTVCLNMHIRIFLSEFMTTLLVRAMFSIYIIQKKVTFQWYSHCDWWLVPRLQMSQSLKGASLRQPSTLQ